MCAKNDKRILRKLQAQLRIGRELDVSLHGVPEILVPNEQGTQGSDGGSEATDKLSASPVIGKRNAGPKGGDNGNEDQGSEKQIGRGRKGGRKRHGKGKGRSEKGGEERNEADRGEQRQCGGVWDIGAKGGG